MGRTLLAVLQKGMPFSKPDQPAQVGTGLVWLGLVWSGLTDDCRCLCGEKTRQQPRCM